MVPEPAAEVGRRKHDKVWGRLDRSQTGKVRVQDLVKVGGEPIHDDVKGIVEGEVVDLRRGLCWVKG